MRVIVVANPKGGVGKSTLATNVAGWLAHQGQHVMLGDLDRQHSSRQWLGIRPATVPVIQGWDLSDGDKLKPPKGVSHVVIDTPAGLRGKRLAAVLALDPVVLVPLQASLFDMQATHAFIDELAQAGQGHLKRTGLVGMRVKDHTIAADRLTEFVSGLPVPLVTQLRDTQNYIHLAAHGLTLWDVAPGRVERDRAQWAPLTRWICDA
ncbi:ParA family protein [Ideonella margarita]|uniref:ParA family protein n=1 Tax=Ideonella margarita TaxID=2984191 RepID=A0ABU9BZW6_9BURK